jgi:putative SOS response-associated peptidase YedK
VCFEFTLNRVDDRIVNYFTLTDVRPPAADPPSVFPDMTVAVIGRKGGSAQRGLIAVKWGLLPNWYNDAAQQPQPANARSETVNSLGMFREAFHTRRCLIPGDAFYEWTEAKPKRRYRLSLKDGSPIGFAGLWDRWDGDGKPILSATMLTTSPNELIGAFHGRMPVILSPADYDVWLDPDTPADRLLALLRPYPSDLMAAELAPRASRSRSA